MADMADILHHISSDHQARVLLLLCGSAPLRQEKGSMLAMITEFLEAKKVAKVG